MQQLVDDAPDGARDLVALWVLEPRQSGVEAQQFGLDDLRRALTQRGDGRGDLGETLRGQVLGQFGGDDGAGGVGVGCGGTGSRIPLQRSHVEHDHLGQSGDGGFDVARQAQVADHERAVRLALRRREGAVRVGERDDGTDRAGTGDQDVGLGHRVGEVVEVHRDRVDAVAHRGGGEVLGPLAGPVDDEDASDAGAGEVRDRQAAHRTGAEDDGGAADESAVAEDPGGAVEGDGHHGRARGVDPGLGVHTLADPQRLLRQLVQRAARGLLRVGGRVGGTDLTEDLLLADDHRIETTGDREEVLGGCLAVPDVRVLVQFGQIESGMRGQQVTDLGERAVEGVDDGIDLDAVARRDDHRLGDVRRGEHPVGQLRTVGVGHRDPLEDGDGSTAVRDPDEKHTHGLITDPFLVEAPTATDAAETCWGDCSSLRARLKESTCISIARSTRRIST